MSPSKRKCSIPARQLITRYGDAKQSIASPTAAALKDLDNRPAGDQPKGNPPVAGHSTSALSAGRVSSSYPPIFYARPGESWEQY